jgi:hypothetical protein
MNWHQQHLTIAFQDINNLTLISRVEYGPSIGNEIGASFIKAHAMISKIAMKPADLQQRKSTSFYVRKDEDFQGF